MNDDLDLPGFLDRRPKRRDIATPLDAVPVDIPATEPLLAKMEALANDEKSSRRATAKVQLDLEVDRYIDDVVEKMKAHLANIDGAQVTMVSETKKAALLLVEARNKYPDRERDICKRVGVTFEGTRYYELLAIGAGRKSIEQIKDANAKRKREERDRKKVLPKPAPKLAPAPPAPIIRLTPRTDPVVRDVTDRKPEPESTAPKLLSAQEAMSLIYPILERVETQALGSVATQVSAYSARRRNAAKPEDDRTDPHGIKWRLSGAIARWCGVEVYRQSGEGLKFVGMRVDVEMAMWAIEDLADQVFQRLIEHMVICLAPPRERKSIKRDFVVGITDRICDRLVEEIEQSATNRTNTGKALVVLKRTAIDAALKACGIKIRTRCINGHVNDFAAYNRGREVGDSVTFGRPISGKGAVLQIGRR